MIVLVLVYFTCLPKLRQALGETGTMGSESYNVGRQPRSCDTGPVAQWLRRRAYVNIPLGVFMPVPRRFVVQSRAGPLFFNP